MPVITDIKHQKRSDDRFSVYVDGEYAFSLSSLDMSTSGLKIGQELSEGEVEEYRSLAGANKAYNLAIRFLSFRPRSKREMSDYLRRKGYEGEQIAPVLERLESARLLDDKAFSASWVASRQSLKPRSKRRLEQELMAKGVSRDDIAETVGAIDSDTELDSLVQVAQRKRTLSQYQDPNKLMGYLARQGYSYDLIKKALERLE
jgi:regulatory protein